MDFSQFGEREIGELAKIIRYFRRNGFFGDGQSGVENFAEGGLLVRNTETSTIPAYGCMEVTGTENETDGPNFVKVKKPTSTGTLFLFNGHNPIDSKGDGRAQTGSVLRVYKNSGTVTLGDRWKFTAGQYYLTKDPTGQFTVYGEDDIGTGVFRVIDDRNPRVKHVVTGGSSIAAFNESTDTMGSGTVTEHSCNSSGVLTATSNTFTAYNPGGLIAANSRAVVGLNEAGLWIFLVVKCA